MKRPPLGRDRAKARASGAASAAKSEESAKSMTATRRAALIEPHPR
jgi:hypothetical protein